MIADKISYYDGPDRRTLDLRPDGVDCIPALEYSNISDVWEDMPIHIHPGVMEFCLCLKGNLVFDTPDGSYPFLPGSIFVSAPDQPHNLRHNPSGLKVYDILFKIPKPHQRLLGLDERGSAWLAKSLTHPPKRLYASTPAVKSAFERLFETYDGEKRGTPARRVKMRAAALDLLLELVVAARRLPPKSPDWVDEIARRIRDNPSADYSIETLAKRHGVSVATFSKSFKQAKGLPLHAFLLDCRINHAKRQLRETARSVAAIGHGLGFCSTQHFARTFRRIVGLTPSQWRRRSKVEGQGVKR